MMFSPPPIPPRYSSQHFYLSNFIVFFTLSQEIKKGGNEGGNEGKKERESERTRNAPKITKMKVEIIKISIKNILKENSTKMHKNHCVCFVLANYS